jgi:hypothetical protein
MDTRRFRKHPSSEALAQVRWLGWVMIMMFVLVQTAIGATASRDRSEEVSAETSSYVQARADFDLQTRQVTVEANPAVLASADTLKWPDLELPASRPIQIPLRATAAPQITGASQITAAPQIAAARQITAAPQIAAASQITAAPEILSEALLASTTSGAPKVRNTQPR